MSIRPVGPEHLTRIARLVRTGFEELQLDEKHLRANLFEDPDFEPDLCVGWFEGTELVAMAMAVARGSDRPDGSVGHLKILQAREDPGSNALIGKLLETVERTLRDEGTTRVQTGGAAPVYLLPGLPRHRHSIRALLEGAGYRNVERRRSMTVELPDADLDTSGAEKRLSAGGVLVRRGRGADRAAIPAQVRSIFSESFAFEVDRGLDDVARGSVHVALEGRRLAGFSVAGLWAANAFGPLGTAPDLEGRGIGATLLKRALRDLRAGGVVTAVIPWVGPEEFYRRAVNAETTLEYDVLEKTLTNELAN